MTTRRRFARWLPLLPFSGTLAVRSSTAAQGAVPSIGGAVPESIRLITPYGAEFRELPHLAVWWAKQGSSFPIRMTQAGALQVTVDRGLTLTDSTIGGLVDLARQAYGLAH